MREVLNRLKHTAAHRGLLAWWLALTAAGCALTALPLMGLPGYELSAGVGLLLTFGGWPFGVAQGFRLKANRPVRDVAEALLVAWAPLGLMLAVVFTVASVVGLLSPCAAFAAVGFFPVVTLPSSLLVAALGLAVGRVSWSRRGALGWCLALIFVSAVHTVWPILFGPQVFAYNHLAGFLPGPLYDEELALPASLLWFRLGTLGLTLAVVGLTATSLQRTRGGVWLFLLGLGSFAALEVSGTSLGFRMSDGALSEALGGVWESPTLELHYPRGLPTEEAERFARDVAFRRAQIISFLGAEPEGRVRVWLYRSAEEKQRLVGAAHTQFSKPWRREVHVNAMGFPHPVLKHELVHALAGPWGTAPFGVPMWAGVVPQTGVIEGFAVAADDPVDRLTLADWAAAMKHGHLLPDVRTLLSPTGFYAAPPSRAYTTAGAFLRWLGEAKERSRLRALYRTGDFAGVYGVPLATLAAEWEASLDQVTLAPGAIDEAFGRFHQGSLFERPCAREVARLSEAASTTDDPGHALALIERCAAIQPQEPEHVLTRAGLLRRLGRDADARQSLEALSQRLEGHGGPWADATLTLADLAQQQGRLDDARALLTALTRADTTAAVDRTARVRLAALDLPGAARDAVQRFFAPGNGAVKFYLLRDALDLAPQSSELQYLLGRRLALDGAPADALPYLTRALETPLAPTVAREARRVALEAAFATHDCAQVKALATAAQADGRAASASASDWVARCDWEAAQPRP
jgi:hypothetical protein